MDEMYKRTQETITRRDKELQRLRAVCSNQEAYKAILEVVLKNRLINVGYMVEFILLGLDPLNTEDAKLVGMPIAVLSSLAAARRVDFSKHVKILNCEG